MAKRIISYRLQRTEQTRFTEERQHYSRHLLSLLGAPQYSDTGVGDLHEMDHRKSVSSNRVSHWRSSSVARANIESHLFTEPSQAQREANNRHKPKASMNNRPPSCLARSNITNAPIFQPGLKLPEFLDYTTLRNDLAALKGMDSLGQRNFRATLVCRHVPHTYVACWSRGARVSVLSVSVQSSQSSRYWPRTPF